MRDHDHHHNMTSYTNKKSTLNKILLDLYACMFEPLGPWNPGGPGFPSTPGGPAIPGLP